MIRKLFALLALVGLAAAPSTGWAASATYDGTLTVNTWSQGGGTVSASQDTTAGAYADTGSCHYQQTDKTSWNHLVVDSSRNFTFYAFAQPAEGYKFAGWFTADGCEGSPDSDTADGYKVEFSVNKNSSATKTYYAKFVSAATKTDLNDAEITLNPSSANYTGAAQTTTVTVKYGTTTLVEGTDYTVSGDVTATGSGSEDKTYTVTITGIGDNYEGTKSATWTIKAPTGGMKSTAVSTAGIGTPEGNTLAVTDTSMLKPENGVWYAGLTFTWPKSVDKVAKSDSYEYAQYVKPDAASVIIGGTSYAATGATYEGGRIVGVTDDDSYNTKIYGSPVPFTYLKTTTWQIALTPDILKAAEADGTITATASVGSIAWGAAKEGDTDGVRFADYTISIDVSKVVLNDDAGNQVYPHVDYVAQIGAKKYLTLGEALTAVASSDTKTITLIAAAEASAFVVPLGVTVNLGAYGAEGATYNLLVDDDHLGDAGAKIISTKAETVTAAKKGFDVKPDNFTYTLYRAHQHDWAYALNGATLTATCQAADCDVPGATVAMSIKATSNGDGQAPTLSYEGKDDFVRLTDATVGEITYTRPDYSKDNWYVGAYTASCVVTVGSQSYTLTQNFEITKPEGGYTSGFEALGIGGYDVRFGTLAEAAGAAAAGATIYYRGGDFNQQDVYFSSAKDITLDLGGKTVTYNEYDTMTIRNDGVGKVTFINGVVKQPQSGWGNAGQITLTGSSGGSMAFGADVSFVNRATSDRNYLTVTADGIAVDIIGGLYQAGFATKNGGRVVISGGKFWSNDKPTALAADHIVREIEGDYKYEVVEHHHTPTYAAEDNVITATCGADDHEFCGFGTQTLTLNAKDEKVSGQPYSSASIAYSDGFPKKDAVITFWKGDEPVVGDLTVTGDYVAKVTVGGVTAVAEFQIFHEHEYTIEQTDDVTLTATCQAGGTCDAKTRTLTLVAESRDWAKGTVFAASLEDGFGKEIAYTVSYVYKQGGETIAAPKLTGEYTVEATVTINETPYVLTKAFSITKPTGGYSAGFEVKGADGEESKWLCYDSFSDAVAAAEEGGTVVWHEGGDNQRQTTFDFSSDKDITIDLCGKNFSNNNDGHNTIKNSGSGRITLVNGTLRTPGTDLSSSHDIYLVGKLTLGEGISVVKYNSLASAGLNIREGADVILAGGTYRGTLEVDANAKLAITGGKYNTYYSSAMTTYVPDRGDKYVVRSISEDSGNLRYQVVPHTHNLVYTVNGGEVTVVCDATDCDLCNYKSGNGAKLTLAAEPNQYIGVATLGATLTVTDNFPVKGLSIAYFDGDSQPVEDITTATPGSYTAQVTVTEGVVATVSFTVMAEKADLSQVTFALANESFAYNGAEHVNSITTAQFGDYALTEGTDYTVSGDSWTQTGSPAEDKTYTVTLTAVETSNFKGTATLSWTITTLGDKAKFGTPATINGDYGTIAETTMTVTAPTKMVYGNNAWAIGMKVTVPAEGWTVFTPVEFLYFESPKVAGAFNGANAEALSQSGVALSTENISGSKYEKYVTSFSWVEAITPQQIEAAIANGDEKIVRTLKVYALAYSERISLLDCSNNGGLREVEFKMEIPLAGLVLPVPAGATLDMAGTKFANDPDFEGYELLLGKDAKVFGDPTYEDEDEEFGYLPNSSLLKTDVAGYKIGCNDDDAAHIFYTTVASKYNIAYEFKDADGNTLTDVTNPYSSKKNYTVEDEVAFTEPASLDGYEFVGWDPAKIEKGATGKQTITGTFKRSITPTAQVAEVTPAPEGLDVAATFTLGEYAENYRDWKADFILTANQNLAQNAITLKGEIPSQSTGWVPLALADDYTAGTSLSIIGLAMEKLPLALPVYYWELKDMGTFNCGLVANKIEVETKVTVSLVLSKEGEDPMTLATFETTLQKTSTPYEDVVIDDTDDGKTVAPEVKQAAAEKVEELCNSDESNIDAVKTWVKENNVKAADLAKSEYTKASYDLGVALLDKGESVAEVAFDDVAEDSANGFSFKIAVQFEGEATPEVVKAAKEKVVGYIQAVDVLGDEFGPVDANRVEIDLTTGKVTITPAEGKTSEFFKIVIPKDK